MPCLRSFQFDLIATFQRFGPKGPDTFVERSHYLAQRLCLALFHSSAARAEKIVINDKPQDPHDVVLGDTKVEAMQDVDAERLHRNTESSSHQRMAMNHLNWPFRPPEQHDRRE
eukprot:784279-Pyramimonas_sp.AAC.1